MPFAVGYLSAIAIPTIRAAALYILVLVICAVVLFPYTLPLIFVYIGAFAGLSVNAISSLFVNRRKSPWMFGLIGLAGFLILPLVFAGSDKALAWVSRPSFSTCRAASFKVEMGGQELIFSGDPGYYIHDFRRPLNGDSHDISAADRGNRTQFQYFCAEALSSPQPLKHIALEVRPEWLSEAWVNANCDQRDDALKTVLCRLARGRFESDYGEHIEGIVFYPESLADRYFGFMHDHGGKLINTYNGSFSCKISDNESGRRRNYCMAAGRAAHGVFYRVKFVTSVNTDAAAIQNKHVVIALLKAMTHSTGSPGSTRPDEGKF